MSVGLGWGMLITAGVIGAAVVLGRAGVTHMWDPTPLAETLSDNRRRVWLLAVVRLWGLAEVALGGGLLAALVWSGPIALAAPIATCSVLVGYAVWLSYRARSVQPWCACTTGQSPVNLASVIRPLVMAVPVVGLVALAGSGTSLLEGTVLAELAGTLLAGLGLGLIGWFYPEAVTTPAARQQLRVMS